MSDKSLRTKLIRMAHANPELRADLLPLIKTSGLKGTLGAAIKNWYEGLASFLLKKKYMPLRKVRVAQNYLIFECYNHKVEVFHEGPKIMVSIDEKENTIGGTASTTYFDIYDHLSKLQ